MLDPFTAGMASPRLRGECPALEAFAGDRNAIGFLSARRSTPEMSFSLVLVNRAAYQEIRDLMEIADLVRAGAPDIDTYVVSDEAENLVTRELAAQKPSLIVSFGEIR